MVDPSAITQYFGTGISAAYGKVAFYTAFLMISGIVAFAIYYFGKFQFKATVIPGSITPDGKMVFDKSRTHKNRFGWVDKSKTTWRPMYPLFNKLSVKPFGAQDIDAGNSVLAGKFGSPPSYFPIRVGASGDLGSPSDIMATMNVVPHNLRHAQQLEAREIDIEFSSTDADRAQKMMVIVLLIAVVCVVMVMGTTWLSYKFIEGRMKNVDENSAATKTNTLAINNLITSFTGRQVETGQPSEAPQ